MGATADKDGQDRLGGLRQRIDALDDQIHDLLMERAELVVRIGELKQVKPHSPFYRPEREAQIHRRLAARHHGSLPVAALHRIYREIISASLNLEKRLAVAFVGPEATHTHQAALKHFGSSGGMVPVRTIAEVFLEVEAGRADFGVVPVENSTEGMVFHTLDRFVDSPLKICGEILLPVVHNLLSREESLSGVQQVHGHADALDQCRQWLARELPGRSLVEVESTARAVLLAQEGAGGAAIAGVYAADSHDLNVLAEHIEDEPGSENRFLVIGQHTPEPSGDDKSSLLVSFRDKPGFLYNMLRIFAERAINLTRIESRPSRRRAWDYLFFIDFQGHQEEPRVAEALAELAEEAGVITKILGSYPRRAL